MTTDLLSGVPKPSRRKLHQTVGRKQCWSWKGSGRGRESSRRAESPCPNYRYLAGETLNFSSKPQSKGPGQARGDGDVFAGDGGSFLKSPASPAHARVPSLSPIPAPLDCLPRLGTQKLTAAGPAAPAGPPEQQPSDRSSHGLQGNQGSL